MKICWLQPLTYFPDLQPLWDKLEEAVRPVVRPDTEVEFRFLETATNFTRSAYAEKLNFVHFTEAALQAEADGFDGVFLGCWNDPLWEAREVLRIPVGAIGEQSMLAALAMGKRFGVVTVSDKTADSIENDLNLYGLQQRAVARPVRAIFPDSTDNLLLSAVSDPYQDLIPRFEDAAKALIAEGAEVIITGCGYYGPLLRSAGYRKVRGSDVLVLDASTVAFKYLETMTDIALNLGYVKSERCAFQTPPKDRLDMARGSLKRQ